MSRKKKGQYQRKKSSRRVKSNANHNSRKKVYDDNDDLSPPSYTKTIPIGRFCITAFVSSLMLAFGLGCVMKYIILKLEVDRYCSLNSIQAQEEEDLTKIIRRQEHELLLERENEQQIEKEPIEEAKREVAEREHNNVCQFLEARTTHDVFHWNNRKLALHQNLQNELQSRKKRNKLEGTDIKIKIASIPTKSKSHQVDIYDVLHPSMNRLLYLNSMLHTASYGMESHYEAIVHPAMMAHPNPRRIVLVGGDSILGGKVVRELLKHENVEHVNVMLMMEEEDDDEFQSIADEYMEGWNDCSDLIGLEWNHEDESDSFKCLEEDRVEVFLGDVVQWFDRGSFHVSPVPTDHDNDDSEDNDDDEDSSDDSSDDEEQEPFDLIFINALNDDLVKSSYKALSKDGIMVLHLGTSPFNRDSPDAIAKPNRDNIITTITALDFQSWHIYEEGHAGFDKPQSYLIACKDIDCRRDWHDSVAHVSQNLNDRIRRRTRRTTQSKSSDPNTNNNPLLYFDGATMSGYQRPPKSWEHVYCRAKTLHSSKHDNNNDNGDDDECASKNGFDPMIPNIPVTDFQVKTSTLGEGAGRGVFTMVDIPVGAYIMQEDAVHTIAFTPYTVKIVEETLDFTDGKAGESQKILAFMYGYGYESNVLGNTGHFVDSSINTFINHGCNGTFNYGPPKRLHISESQADPTRYPWPQADKTFSPMIDRNFESEWSSSDKALQDIEKGGELFLNYLYLTKNEDEWAETVRSLNAQCSGEEIGLVAMVDNTKDNEGGEVVADMETTWL